VHVNVSAAVLRKQDVAGMLARSVERHGCPAGRVAVELTETALVQDGPRVRQQLERIRQVGATIALDDFGTGYSSLARLEELALDTVKIDQRLIGMVRGSPGRLTPAVIELAHVLNLAVVAEGIEDWSSWERLAELGCDVIQGFCLSRPLPASELEAWLDET
jgi:diguanylate cyclase